MNTISVEIYTATGSLKLENVPAKFEERSYNPCYDVVLVPDTEHPLCPKILVDALTLNALVGPMQNGWDELGTERFRSMGRYEDCVTYDRLSN